MTSNGEFIPAEAFPPGDYLREELEAREWTQSDLSEILGKSLPLVNEVILGKREITPATAQALAAALGTSAQFWLNLEATYRLYVESQRSSSDDASVSRRATVYSKVPVKEIVKRGWIEKSSNVDVLERNVCRFLEISNIEDEPDFIPHAARKSASYDGVNTSQRAWLYRARQLGRIARVERTFTSTSVSRAIGSLTRLLETPEEARHVSKILSEHGIRLVIVEPISKTKIDAVTFWLDRRSPVIAMSLRYDRIDWFWFTLIHELRHVENGDGKDTLRPIIDDLEALRSKEAPESEKRINRWAADRIIPSAEMDEFVARTRPLYSRARIMNFAKRIKVHPGLVVGQLHHRDEVGYSHSRNLLVKIREHVISSTLTDGWGFVPLSL
jgi:HTH-type transcriptional regulator / antitoxin HigA